MVTSPVVVEPDPEDTEWVGHVRGDREVHELSYTDGTPHSSVTSADAYMCVCTQESCGGEHTGQKGDVEKYVRAVDKYGSGWVCSDMVFGTHAKSAVQISSLTAEEEDKMRPRKVERCDAQPQRGGRLSGRSDTQSSQWIEDP